MSQASYAIPKGSVVVVTGANGYIASHVIDLLLELGYHVRGTVRAAKPWLDLYFENKYGKGKFESVVVPAMEREDAFHEITKDAAGFIHVATDVSLSPDPNVVIPNAINGVLNALKASSTEGSIKRFVLTSSSAAALLPKPNVTGIVVDEKTWNDEAVTAAWSDSTPAEAKSFYVYAASKTESEREAWKYIEEKKPGFVLNTVVPNMNIGEILLPEIGGSTMSWVRGLLNGDSMVINLLPPQYYVNVRDTARLHVIALLDPNVNSERLFGFAGEHNWTDVIGILRKLRPNNKKIPNAPENEGRDLSEIVLKKRAEQLLQSFFGRPGWTGLEESIAAGIKDLE